MSWYSYTSPLPLTCSDEFLYHLYISFVERMSYFDDLHVVIYLSTDVLYVYRQQEIQGIPVIYQLFEYIGSDYIPLNP